jgi:glycosyltransferase involved in cell wall biosynthesis
VNEAVQRYHIKRAFVFCSAMARYVLAYQNMLRALDMVDLDTRKWTDYAGQAYQPARSVYPREGIKLFHFERTMAQEFLTTPFSSLWRRRICFVRQPLIPIFSPTRQYPRPFTSSAVCNRKNTGGAFPGVTCSSRFLRVQWLLAKRPSVEWFANAVMPEYERQGQQLEFWIVGANPTRTVQRLAAKRNIRVTGRVADVRPYLAHAAAAVAPIHLARGIQNKILEAMAMGKPVVATPQAKEGIEATAGRERC